MNDVQTNTRGEFSSPVDGRLMHLSPNSQDAVDHEGPWLSCDGCNPVVVVEPKDDPATGTSQMIALRAEWSEAKAQERAAKERLDAAKAKLQAALAEASGGAYRATLVVPGFKNMNLTYSEPWALDTAALKIAHPAVYVEYAEKGSRWTLSESRGRS